MKRRRDTARPSEGWFLRDTNGCYPDVPLPQSPLEEDGLVDLEAMCVELAVTTHHLDSSQSARESRSEKNNALLQTNRDSIFPFGRHTRLPVGQRLLHHAISRVQCVIVCVSKSQNRPGKGRSTTPRLSPYALIAIGASPTYVNGERLVSVEEVVVGELLDEERTEEAPSSVRPLFEGDSITYLEPGTIPTGIVQEALSPLSPLRQSIDTLSAAHHTRVPLPRFVLFRSASRSAQQVERSPSPMTTPHRNLL